MRTARTLSMLVFTALLVPLLGGAKGGCVPVPVEPLDLPHCVEYDVTGASSWHYAANVDTYADGQALLAGVPDAQNGQVIEGTCASIAADCATLYAPVCGTLADQAEYGNLCTFQGAVRKAAGALGKASGAWTDGTCGAGAGCLTDGDCGSGQVCELVCDGLCKMMPPADPACCAGTCVPAPDDVCEFGGQLWSPGQSFPSTDGCNTCTCVSGGMVACTEKACVGGCTYNGATYADGDSFWSSDGCNTCTCSGGMVGCTKMACTGPGCWSEGTYYEPGAAFPSPDGCNTCTCTGNGLAMCTLKACAPGCSYEGATFPIGESFPASDGCNTCTCTESGVACTEMACACDPKTDWWRDYVSTDASQCPAIDYLCPPNTNYFFNGCGCGCEQDSSCPEWFNCMPSPDAPGCDVAAIQAKCPYSGIAW